MRTIALTDVTDVQSVVGQEALVTGFGQLSVNKTFMIFICLYSYDFSNRKLII